MGKAAGIIVAIVLIVAGVGGAWYLFNTLPGHDDEAVTMIIDFTAMDVLAGSRDADTTAIDIYRMIDGDLVKQESVTLDAASKASANTYTSGEKLWIKLYDSSDTSLCTQYLELTVPKADPSWIYDGAFQIRLDTTDKGDTAKDILIQYHNNTAIAASATLDVTNESWDSNYAEIDIELRALDDDTGYVNTKNFLKDYGNYHYIILKASGTGWDSVNMLSTGWSSYDKASARYFVIKLSNDDLTRDKQSNGEFDPDGTFVKNLLFDLTGFESGDSVTLAYEYRWYSCFDHFQSTSSWGTDTAATTETVTVQY